MLIDPQEQQRQLLAIQHALSSERVVSVLIVDDSAEDSEMAKEKLQAHHLEVGVAYNCDIAAQMLEHNGFSVVFMDWKLVGKTGLEALKMLKSVAHAHIIILTGTATRQDAALALANGAAAVMAKPLTEESINLIFGTP